jgi:hypothetical protein
VAPSEVTISENGFRKNKTGDQELRSELERVFLELDLQTTGPQKNVSTSESRSKNYDENLRFQKIGRLNSEV